MNDLIELLVKASLLQNSRTREIAELFSKFKSATDADSILRYRSVCCNLLQMIETNQIPLPTEAEKQQQKANVQLLQNLNLLAYASSSIYKKIDDVTGSHLQESVQRPIRKVRVFCQNFDKTYAAI